MRFRVGARVRARVRISKVRVRVTVRVRFVRNLHVQKYRSIQLKSQAPRCYGYGRFSEFCWERKSRVRIVRWLKHGSKTSVQS